jgi:small subunit ribosomal protein S20
MANHKSALKRIRSTERRTIRNRYYAKSMRTSIKNFRSLTDKAEAEKRVNSIISLIDKNAKRNIIHSNKAANLKSKLVKYMNSL